MVVLWMGGKQIDTVEDAGLLARLRLVDDPVQLKDEDGKILGEYVPSSPFSTLSSPPIPWEPQTTLEDIRKRMEEPGLTYEEVKRRLGRE